jgi:hypothetical protein
MARRRQRIDQSYLLKLLARLASFDIRKSDESDLYIRESTVALANAHRPSVYYAAYLELPRRFHLSRAAMMDGGLVQVAMKEIIKARGV